MSKIWKTMLMGLMLLPVSGQAESGFYLGAGFGGSRLEQDIGVTVTIFTDTAVPRPPDPSPFVDELQGTDAGFKLFAGYQFGQYVAVEAGYVDLGKAEDGVAYLIPFISTPFLPPSLGGLPNGCPPTDPNCFRSFQRGDQDREIESSLEIDGWLASLVGIWPVLERVEVIGKVGVIGWDSRQVVQDRVAALLPVDQPSVPAVIIPGAPVGADGGAALRIVEDDGTDLALGLGVNLKVTERMALRGEFEWFDIDNTDLAWLASFAVIAKF